ncbi:MAG: carbohydrate ABC transporter permease [Chloroflexi bacterium]|nr:carbohydrate ABC transporter permease [Chloroflexota bacterium]
MTGPIARAMPKSVLKYASLSAVALIVAYPFYFMVSNSFKDLFEATTVPPTLFPSVFHPENYVKAWEAAPWARYFANTAFVAITTTLGEVVTAVLAAYAFARLEFRGRTVLFGVFLATLMIPSEATLIPNYIMMSKRGLGGFGLGWYDTYQVQIVPFLASVFSIFLLRQFFLSIPRELSDAARIDGAGHLRFLWSIVLPLSVPSLVTVSLFSFIGSWNSLLWPLIMTSVPEYRPVQLGLSAFRQEAGNSYHLLLAAATFTIAPIVLLYLVAQRHLIQGVARSGMKG